jgi:heat shock protein HslJ
MRSPAATALPLAYLKLLAGKGRLWTMNVSVSRMIVVGLVAGFFVAGCEATSSRSGETMSLVGTSWIAEDIDGRGVIDNLQSTLRFEASEQVSGMAGCNRFFGTVTIDGDAISFGALGATRMACPPAIMDQEDRFLKALANARRFETKDGLLFFFGDEAVPLLRFSRKESE